MSSVVIAILLWSSLGVVIRLSGMAVHVLIFYSALISAIVSGFVIFITDIKKEIRSKKSVLPLLSIAPVSLLNTFTFFYAYKNTTIANAVITHYIAPVVVAFIAPILLKEKFTLKTVFAALVAILGLWLMLDFSPVEFLNSILRKDSSSIGILSGILSGFAYAGVVLLIRALAINHNPFIMTFFQNSIIALMLLPFLEGSFVSVRLWPIIVMGLIHSTVAPVLYFYGMKTVTASRGALIGYLEPVSSILLGIIFLKELITLKTVVGGALVLLSGYITLKPN